MTPFYASFLAIMDDRPAPGMFIFGVFTEVCFSNASRVEKQKPHSMLLH